MQASTSCQRCIETCEALSYYSFLQNYINSFYYLSDMEVDCHGKRRKPREHFVRLLVATYQHLGLRGRYQEGPKEEMRRGSFNFERE